jgi:hypothetical protein
MWSTAAAGLWFLLVGSWANPTTPPPTTTIAPTANNTTAPTTANATVTNSTAAAANATLDALVRAVFVY